MKITIEQEGKETKVFEGNACILILHTEEYTNTEGFYEESDVFNGIMTAVHLSSAARNLVKRIEGLPAIKAMLDISESLRTLQEKEEADNDAGKV